MIHSSDVLMRELHTNGCGANGAVGEMLVSKDRLKARKHSRRTNSVSIKMIVSVASPTKESKCNWIVCFVVNLHSFLD
jgi:hypothetical protein